MSTASPIASNPVALSVIIVNWNSKDYLRQCLTSLFRHCTSIAFEIIVVDGASFDGCGEMLAREFPSVIFIQSQKNVGFAKANNLGARSARGDYLLLLNPDTEFTEDSIGIMMSAFARLPNAGAIGCRLLNADQTVQATSVLTYPTAFNRSFDSDFLRRHFPKTWGMEPLLSKGKEPSAVEAVSGACILIPRAIFERVSGFTESYFMYCEDVDLCFKLHRGGHPVFHLPTTSIIHYGGGSSSQAVSNFSTVLMRESWFQFIKKNRGYLPAIIFRVTMSTTAFFRLILIGPLMLLGRRFVRHGSGSWKKWLAVLKWGMGIESVKIDR